MPKPFSRRRRSAAASPATALRFGWGCALLLVPEVVLRLGGRPPAPPVAVALARVLGARQLVQAVVITRRPARSTALISAAVDGLHASTELGLAACSRRWRPIALLDAAIATGLAAASTRTYRRLST